MGGVLEGGGGGFGTCWRCMGMGHGWVGVSAESRRLVRKGRGESMADAAARMMACFDDVLSKGLGWWSSPLQAGF